MRLKNVSNGHRWPQKLKLAMIRLLSRFEAPDVVKTLSYRPEFFGQPFSACLQQVMRGPSDWSIGERELFASFVSRQNQCLF
ncbi:MAG: hypothetical protein H7338_04755 [Candidatus Sericytochromatia bacterium]|nr:hypothetical protein [Candidatus Sericytochromatia bacterium]